ncbi:MAG TPA: GGDEF domain-containing protein [Roseiarcus sp.]|nr:GGDEF domain-containing protein [Roseiarcus sp.]
MRPASSDGGREEPAIARRAGGGAAPASDKAAKLLHSAKRTTLIIAAAYLYDTLILFGYWAAGFVDIAVPVAVFALLAALIGAVALAHATGWSLGRRDPTLFLPHQLYAIAVALGVALVAPQIGFQPFATLFAISAFSFMAPNARSLIIAWVAVAIGAAAVIFLVGPRLAVPASTLAGQALTSAVIAGLLARCIWIAMFVRTLRGRLAEKNRSLTAAMARIETLATTDEVTGLPNRRAIAESLREHMALSRRAGLPLSLAFVDIDHFKRINDAYGHLAGDGALQLIAGALRVGVRESDRVGRFGGEEFLIVMPSTALKEAREPLERLREDVARLDWSSIGLDVQATVTIGAAQYAPGEALEALVRRADLALYLGKETGRNRVVLNPPVEQSGPRRRALSA